MQIEIIIRKLLELKSTGLVVNGAQWMLKNGQSPEYVLEQLRSMAKDNPPLMEEILGTDLYSLIINP